MSEIKKIDVKFLRDSGLLFEINRQILHPFGLALEIYTGAKGGYTLNWFAEDGIIEGYYLGEEAFGKVWDYRDDPEGMLFDEEAFKQGKEKFEKFMNEFGNKKLEERKSVLGYIVQEK